MREQVTDLLNRLQASDFKTYAALQGLNTGAVAAFEDVRAKTDLEEIRILGKANGVGYELYDDGTDDELGDTFSELFK